MIPKTTNASLSYAKTFSLLLLNWAFTFIPFIIAAITDNPLYILSYTLLIGVMSIVMWIALVGSPSVYNNL